MTTGLITFFKNKGQDQRGMQNLQQIGKGKIVSVLNYLTTTP
jgi:hypothetical protein